MNLVSWLSSKKHKKNEELPDCQVEFASLPFCAFILHQILLKDASNTIIYFLHLLVHSPALFPIKTHMKPHYTLKSLTSHPQMHPRGVAVLANQQIVVVSSSSYFLLSREANFIAEFGNFKNPHGVTVDRQGNLLFADLGEHLVKIYNSKHEFLHQFNDVGEGDKLLYPYGLAISKQNNIVVSDQGNSRICVFTNKGTFISKFGASFSTSLLGISIDNNDHVYIVDQEGNFIRRMGGRGVLNLPMYVAVDGDGNCAVSDREPGSISLFSSSGKQKKKFGYLGKKGGELVNPRGIAFDSQDNLIIGDQDNFRLSIWR